MITIELLKSWKPCTDGFRRFCELFPDGADLHTAGEKLAEDGHPDWGLWLYNKARERNLFSDVTALGYQNSGNRNSGYQNSGNQNSGDWNSGNQNSGHWNSGNRNSGNQNSGDRNSGYQNSGYQNSGDRNSGYQNSGDRNSGYQNSGNQNSGDRNSGHWNSGHWNSGFFNNTTPDTIRVFGKDCLRTDWDAAIKPNFLYFELTVWINESDMTDEEKAADPQFYVRGGQLRTKDYKEAFKESWDKADQINRELVRKLPNFDAEIFFDISGIDLR